MVGRRNMFLINGTFASLSFDLTYLCIYNDEKDEFDTFHYSFVIF